MLSSILRGRFARAFFAPLLMALVLLSLCASALPALGEGDADDALYGCFPHAVELREAARGKARVVVRVPAFAALRAEAADDGWLCASFRGLDGFARAEGFQPLSRAEAERRMGDPDEITGTFPRIAYVRAHPKANDTVLSFIPVGEVVTIARHDEKWGTITFREKTGYVYVKDIDHTLSARELAAIAEGGEQTQGYFASAAFLRTAPEGTSATIGRVPLDAPLAVARVSEDWGVTTYAGDTGFVWLSPLLPLPEVTPLAPFDAFSAQARHTRVQPLQNAETSVPLPAEERFLVTGEFGDYYRVQIGDTTAFTPKAYVSTLKPDHAVAPRDLYFTQETRVLAEPLRNSDAAGALSAMQVVTVSFENRGYGRVTVGDMEGYVPLRGAKVIKDAKTQDILGYFETAAPFFTQPADGFESGEAATPHALVFIDGMSGDYYRLMGTSMYARKGDLVRIHADAITPFYGYWSEAQALLRNVSDPDSAQDVRLPDNTPLEIRFRAGAYYVVEYGDSWGFVPAKDCLRLEASETLDTVFAVTNVDAPFLTTFADDPAACPVVPKGTPLLISQRAPGFCLAQVDGVFGYLPEKSVTFIFADAPLTAVAVTLPDDMPLFDFPDSRYATQTALIPAGTRVRLLAANRCWLRVQAGRQVGYARMCEALLTEETASVPREESDARYALRLNKATHTLSVWRQGADGGAEGKPLITVVVTTGKRTTPTPSGTFVIGQKRRWRYFGPSYAPYLMTYRRGRYLHGPLYAERSDASIKRQSLSEFGLSVSGGCVRVPVDIIKWLYFNCSSYVTTLTVVNGEAEDVPDVDTDGAPEDAPGVVDVTEGAPDVEGLPEDAPDAVGTPEGLPGGASDGVTDIEGGVGDFPIIEVAPGVADDWANIGVTPVDAP